MLVKETLNYRHMTILPDGTRVLLRALVPEDRSALCALYAPVTPEERAGMRHDVRDPAVVGAWADQVDYELILPLVALTANRIVGNATLHFNAGTAQHRAEVRVFLAKDFRGRGLGSQMLKILIELARRRNVFQLEAQILSEQTSVVKAFQALGFKVQCSLPDYYMKPDGELCDVLLATLPLRVNNGDF